MDRLLQFLLKTFIRRGRFKVTTSRGTVLTFGDGTGRPVSVRFATRRAEWGILLDPELKFGKSYMNGTLRGRARLDRRRARRHARPELGSALLGAPAMAAALPLPPPAAIQSAPARAPQRRASLRSRCPPLFAVPRRRPAIQLRLFRGARHHRSTTPSSPRSATSPPSCCCARIATCACSTSAAAGAASGSISPRSPAPT